MFKVTRKLKIDSETASAANLCNKLTSEDLVAIGQLVLEGYRADKYSRRTWLKRNEAGLNLALQLSKAKSWPWPGCSNVVFPLVAIGVLQFSARAYGNLIQGTEVVGCRVIGEDFDGEAKKRSDRIGCHMSWQVMEQDCSWEEQHDKLYINAGAVGCAFIKTQYDGGKAHNTSDFVQAKNLVLNYYARSVEECPRKTEILSLFKNDVYERITDERWRKEAKEETWFSEWTPPPAATAASDSDQDRRQGVEPPPTDADTAKVFFEQHRLLDLDGDGYAEPYIVTSTEEGCVVRIVARWERDEDVKRTVKGSIIRINPTEYYTKFGLIPSPDGGIYDIGFGTLLGPINESVNSAINQLLDNGTMQNSLGGFLGRGAKIRGGVYTMAPWEWKRVDSTGDDLRKQMVPYPDRPASTVMFQLLGLLIEYSDRLGSTTDQMVGKTPGQNTPAETSRNTLEQGLQVFSAIFKRLWRSQKEEFKKLWKLNAIYLPERVRFGDGKSYITREDYRTNPDQVRPVADPNITSFSMKMMQAEQIRQASLTVPGYDRDAVERLYLKAMRVEGIDQLYKGVASTPPQIPEKIQLEQLRQKGKMLELKARAREFMFTLMEERRLNTAKIMELQAKAAAEVTGANAAEAGQKIAALNLAMEAIMNHNAMIDSQMQKASEDSSLKTEGSELNADNQNGPSGSNAGGPADDGTAGSLEEPPGNGDVSDDAGEMEGEPGESVDEGAVSE